MNNKKQRKEMKIYTLILAVLLLCGCSEVSLEKVSDKDDFNIILDSSIYVSCYLGKVRVHLNGAQLRELKKQLRSLEEKQ